MPARVDSVSRSTTLRGEAGDGATLFRRCGVAVYPIASVGVRHPVTIDFEALVSRFFWDTDFRMGAVLLQAEEWKPGRVQASRQAWKIAAGLRPDPEDLQIVPWGPTFGWSPTTEQSDRYRVGDFGLGLEGPWPAVGIGVWVSPRR